MLIKSSPTIGISELHEGMLGPVGELDASIGVKDPQAGLDPESCHLPSLTSANTSLDSAAPADDGSIIPHVSDSTRVRNSALESDLVQGFIPRTAL